MDKNDFSEWLEQKLHEQFDATKGLLAELVNLVELEQKAAEKGIEQPEEFMMVDDNGDLKQVDIDDLKINATATLADKLHDASLTLKQLFIEAWMMNKPSSTKAGAVRPMYYNLLWKKAGAASW